jgi:hypothetical protein
MSKGPDGYEAMLARAVPGKNQPLAAEEEMSERFYGYVPGIQDRAHNLEFRKSDGSWPFLEYSYLVGGEAVHAGEFVLRFATGERVTVRGRNLRPLYEKLLRHRVTWLRDAARGEKAADRELFIDEIVGPVKDEEGEGGSG